MDITELTDAYRARYAPLNVTTVDDEGKERTVLTCKGLLSVTDQKARERLNLLLKKQEEKEQAEDEGLFETIDEQAARIKEILDLVTVKGSVSNALELMGASEKDMNALMILFTSWQEKSQPGEASA